MAEPNPFNPDDSPLSPLTESEYREDRMPGSPGGPDTDSSIGIAGKIKPGQVLFGRYLVDSQLGEGGMGTVWLVRHLGLGVPRALKLIVSVVEKMLGEGGMGAVWLVRYLGLGVPRALKLIIPGIAFDPQARARFKREAQVMARLSHPNAVIVHNARMSKDAAFIEMEYIRGQSLNKLMCPGVPMSLDWVARILEQLCDVLLYAHDRGIVHQDLKPSNLMLLDGRPPDQEWLKVLDFGIAQILGATDHEVDVRTRPGRFLGTAPYSSPEQLVGELADAAQRPVCGRGDALRVPDRPSALHRDPGQHSQRPYVHPTALQRGEPERPGTS